MDNVIYSSAKTLAGLVRKGEVSASELVDGCLTRIDEVNGKLNAVVQFCAERARDRGQSPPTKPAPEATPSAPSTASP